MSNVGGVGAGPNVNFDIDPVNTERLEDMDPNLAAHVENVETALNERLEDLAQQIADADNPQAAMQLEGEMRALEREFQEFSNSVEGANSAAINPHLSSEKIADQVGDIIDDFHSVISSSYAEFGTATVPADLDVEAGAWCPVGDGQVGDLSDADLDADPGADIASTGDGESPEVGEMVDLLQNDPDAFQEAMSDLDADERQGMMMAIQNELQQINQLFSMMTQFSQAMHDTSKAVIQNLRV